ncbi:MAG: 3-deoxy-manno-octulosonate cytidylyltransferase [Candidatus Omnitrophica bacterium]|nr:3-deoxy-manno-octulosonate cytidylyltransferase [Candidatus Omnitrophota bacterium]
MKTIGIIPARFHSTRFQGKVLADLGGKSVIQHVWENAKKSQMLDDLIIAADDERIISAAQGFGAKAVYTSPDQPSGTDRLIEVVNPIDVEVVVNIQGDEPLVRPEMVDELARALLDDKDIKMATLAKRIEDEAEIENPNVVKVAIDRQGYALYFSRARIPYPRFETVKPYFKHLGLYSYTKDFLFEFANLPKSNLEMTEGLEQLRALENGCRIKVIETKFDTIGIDTPEDLERARSYLGLG